MNLKTFIYIMQVDEVLIWSDGTIYIKNIAGYSEFSIKAHSDKEAQQKLYKEAYKRFNINKKHQLILTDVKNIF